MTFLAILIGQETDRIPTTDTYQGMSTLFNVEKQSAFKNSRVIRNSLRNTILENVLPVPCGLESYTDIIRFRDKYRDELVRFRRHVEDFIASLDGLPSELQEERCQFFVQNSQDEIEMIKDHMGSLRAPKIDMGTLVAALPCVFDAALGNFGGAAIGLAGIIREMVWNSDKNVNRAKPLAYAALYRSRYTKPK